MRWASAYIAKLANGEPVSFRPRGNSMEGKIDSGQFCTVEPIDPSRLRVGDIVLCNDYGREYLHLIKAGGKRIASKRRSCRSKAAYPASSCRRTRSRSWYCLT
jgi:hypothetical protein